MVPVEDCSDLEWDRFLASCPQGYHEQTSQYATQRRDYGYQSARAVLRDETGRIEGGVQLLFLPTPIGRLGLCLRGPVARKNTLLLLTRLVTLMEAMARKHRLASIRVEAFGTQTAALQSLTEAGYLPTTAWAEETVSEYIDPQMNDEALFAKIRKTARKQIRSAERKGVVVTVNEDNACQSLHQLYTKTADFHGFPTFPASYFNYLSSLFGPEKSPVFIASYKGTPLAGLMCLPMQNRLYTCWYGMNRDPDFVRMNVTRFLYFEMVKWARELGIDGIDLTGTSLFRNQISHCQIIRPPVMRMHYGPAKGLHRLIVEATGNSKLLRSLAFKIGFRMGYFRMIPH